MKRAKKRATATRLGLLVALFSIATGLGAPGATSPPSIAPPEPPSPPEVSVKGFTIRPGDVHKGNVVRIAPSVSIEGTLDGDLYVTSPTVSISGIVTGDVFAAGSQVDVTGEIKQSFRAFAANVVVEGTVDGNALVTGGSLRLGSKSHVKGSVSAYTGQLTHRGVIDGSLTFTGGTATLGGKVMEDAALTADKIDIESGARIEGDIEYSTRKPMDEEFKAIAGGEVAFNEAPVEEKRKREDKDSDLRPSTFGVGKWIAFFTASFLFGCALLAVFGSHEPRVTQAIATDALRCAGIGFVSILVTIAVVLSSILLITIPFVVIYMLAYIVAIYLAKIPIAIWAGRFILGKAKRESGPYLALFVGLVALYLVFMLPYFGVLAQLLAALLGLGAMTMTYLAHRQAKQAPPIIGAEAVSQ